MKKSMMVISMVMITLVWMMVFSGCENRKPINLGFVGCLTGRLSDLGISGRDGVLLAVEEINGQGGINGRPVNLIVKDDRHDRKTALEVDKDLIRAGVAAIIGHMTSSMSMAVVAMINREKVVMISPTTSTDMLAEIDDYFFRALPPNSRETVHLAGHAYDTMGLRKMAVVYDLSNRDFTEGWYRNFKSAFEQKGGGIVHTAEFTSGNDVAYMALARAAIDSNSDGLVIIGGAIDTAMICQQLKKAGANIPVIVSGWSKTDELIRHGGVSVEGVLFSSMFNHESRHPDYLRFKTSYENRFGREPDFASTYAYEAAQMLFKALSNSKADKKNLKPALLNIGTIQGLQGDIMLDQFGDARRTRFLLTVRDGRFRVLE